MAGQTHDADALGRAAQRGDILETEADGLPLFADYDDLRGSPGGGIGVTCRGPVSGGHPGGGTPPLSAAAPSVMPSNLDRAKAVNSASTA